MRTINRGAAAAFIGVLFLPLQAVGQALSLEEAVDLALRYSPDLRINAIDADKAGFQKKSAFSSMGPKFGLSGKILRWDEPTDLSLNIPNVSMSMHVMDQTTSDIGFQVAQPLTPLYSMYNAYEAQAINEEALGVQRRSKEEEVRYRVAEAFFNLLKLIKAREITETAVSQVNAHLETARQFYRNGLVQEDDVLRAEVALAKAQDALEQVGSGIEVTTALLNMQMGRPLDEPLEPKDEYPAEPQGLAAPVGQCIDEALKNRNDLKELGMRIRMAEAGKRAVMGTMLPTVSAVFNWTKQWGNEFSKPDSYFVGGMLSWTFWEWGATYYQIEAAERDIKKLEEVIKALKDGIALDVKSAYLQAKTAFSSLAWGRKAIEQAAETLRIVNSKYENKQATSIEVLDAEGTLTAAKSGFVSALYTYYLAMENLNRAMKR